MVRNSEHVLLIPVIKKCFNGLHHESVKRKQGRVKRSVIPIPGYDMEYCHFTKEQDKEICIDSNNMKIEDIKIDR